MRKILWSLCLYVSVSQAQIKDTSFAQIDEKLQTVSEEMIKFHNQFQSGILLEVIGGLTLGIGAVQNKTPVTVIGGIVSLFGLILNAGSTTHIKNAGIALKGSTLTVPIATPVKKDYRIFKRKHQ